MMQEIWIKQLVLSKDHDKRDKELFDKRMKQYENKGWEKVDYGTVRRKIDIKI